MIKVLIVSIFALHVVVSCAQPYDISVQSVKENISYLASDKMKGRYVFTPELDSAASFIEDKFQDAGLSYFPGLQGFKQDFFVMEISVLKASVDLNGQEVSPDKFFIFGANSDYEMESTSLNSGVIDASSDFQQKFSDMLAAKKEIILVDKKHKRAFNGYKSYFDGAQTTMSIEKSSSPVVIILTNENNVESASVKIKTKKDQKRLTNVVGMIEGKQKDEIVIFSGHYDHIGMVDPVKGDSIANGANDDASGVTAVIELANYFASGEKPERTLCFVAFTAEESGGYGSKYFSNQLNPDEIVAMFNIEMIGKPAVSGPNSAWITGFDRSNFGELMQESAKGSGYEFYPDPYPAQNLFYRSDNATLARLGVPAHSISTTPIDVDKDYHQVSDHVETLDLDHLTNTIKALIVGAKGIVDGSLTPTRVDPAKMD